MTVAHLHRDLTAVAMERQRSMADFPNMRPHAERAQALQRAAQVPVAAPLGGGLPLPPPDDHASLMRCFRFAEEEAADDRAGLLCVVFTTFPLN